MPVTLTYVIPPFIGVLGQVTVAAPTSLGIDNSQHQSGEATVTPDGPTGIKVSPGSVALNVRIQDGSRGIYYPVGLAVQPVTGGVRVPTTVFPVANVSPSDNTTIQLTDNSAAGAGSYEFVVLFQAPNSNFGWLDPRIANDSSR